MGGIDIFLCPRVELGRTLLCVAWCGRLVKESKVSILVYTCLNLSLLVWTCLYLSELRRCTLSSVKESSVVASPLSCSPSPADSWCDVHEVPPWHLPTNKLRFFWRLVIDVLITDPFGYCDGNTKTSMKVYLIPLLMIWGSEFFGICCWWSEYYQVIIRLCVDDQDVWWSSLELFSSRHFSSDCHVLPPGDTFLFEGQPLF